MTRLEKNIARTLRLLKVWEAKLLRATNRVKKLRAAKKRYDRLLAKAAREDMI